MLSLKVSRIGIAAWYLQEQWMRYKTGNEKKKKEAKHISCFVKDCALPHYYKDSRTRTTTSTRFDLKFFRVVKI